MQSTFAETETLGAESPRKEIPPEVLRPRSWVWLMPAAALLLISNGADTVAIAAWLAPVFLLRFARTQRRAVGLAVTYVLLAAVIAFQFRGMVPIPGVGYYIFLVTMGIPLVLPYAVDRLTSARLDGLVSTLIFPTAWVATEYLMSLGIYGSWLATPYSQYGSLPLLQILSVTGMGGVTFLIGWFAAVCNWVWEEGLDSKRARRGALLCAGTLVAVILAGGLRMAVFPPSGETVRIASLTRAEAQPHVSDAVWGRLMQNKASSAELEEFRRWNAAMDDDLLARSEREAQAGAKIIFWGESNGPVLKEDEAALIARGGELAAKYQIYLGMGLGTWNRNSAKPLENKIVLIQPNGQVAWDYFKAHPVPGGEAAISLTTDGMLRKLDTPYGRISSAICFDADFPRLLAQAGAMSTDVLLDPSNDWRAIDPWHTQMASFRAIEQGFNMVRHTSQGLSAAYDYQGRLLSAMDHYAATNRVLISQVPIKGVRTIYSRFGDWFAWVCLLGVAILAVKAIAAGKPKSLDHALAS